MRCKPFTDLPGLQFPEESAQTKALRIRKQKRIIMIAQSLGVNLGYFDEDVSNVFESAQERAQYRQDVAALVLLLEREEPIPQDLAERLLIIKERRESQCSVSSSQ